MLPPQNLLCAPQRHVIPAGAAIPSCDGQIAALNCQPGGVPFFGQLVDPHQCEDNAAPGRLSMSEEDADGPDRGGHPLRQAGGLRDVPGWNELA